MSPVIPQQPAVCAVLRFLFSSGFCK